MSETENPLDARRLPFVVIIVGMIVLGGFSGVIAQGGGGACSPSYSSGCAKHISFDSATACIPRDFCPLGVNSTSLVLPSVTPGDLVVVFADQYWAANPPPGHITVQSVKDSAGDVYTRQILHLVPLSAGQFDNGMEVWTAFTNASSLTVTVKTNVTLGIQQSIDLVSTYKNVMQVASVNATDSNGQLRSNISQNMTITGSSSWIVGSVFNDDNNACATPTSPVPIFQRITAVGAGLNCGDIADTNAPIIKTNTNFNFSEGIGGGPNYALAQIELTPGYADQLGECMPAQIGTVCPLPSNVCTTANGLCVTSQYSLNWQTRATGANALNQVLAPATAYCTGITTAALTTGPSPKGLEAWGTYGGVSLNTTGLKMNVELMISTTVPQTTFGTGSSCIIGNTVSTIYFAYSGSLSATNSFVTSITNQFGAPLANTVYYASITIAPYNFAGHANFDQVTNQPYSTGTINLMEIK